MTHIHSCSGVHRPPEGQGRNGITRAQSRTRGGGGITIPPRLGVSRFTILSRCFCHVVFSILQMFLSCCFFYFASCLSSTAKLISLL